MPDPYGGKPPHVDTDTSREASRSMESTAGSIRARVLQHIAASPDGTTDNELERALGLRHQTASPRRRELVLKGLIRDSGARRCTDSGRKATVWEVVPNRDQETHRRAEETQGLRNKVKARVDDLGLTQCQAVLDFLVQLPPEPKPKPRDEDDDELDVLTLFA